MNARVTSSLALVLIALSGCGSSATHDDGANAPGQGGAGGGGAGGGGAGAGGGGAGGSAARAGGDGDSGGGTLDDSGTGGTGDAASGATSADGSDSDVGVASVDAAPASTGRLFYLDIGGGRVMSANADGSDVHVLLGGVSSLPDGVAVDRAAGHVFWTNMGVPDANDGFIDRTDLAGKGEIVPVAVGKTFTPKQLKLDAANGKLYWADREGMRIQRANLDGTNLETLVETGTGDTARMDASNWCVGIALDVAGKRIYWTQKGGDNAGAGSVRRAGIDVPVGEDPLHRTDIEILFDALPEPIDLDVDLTTRFIYWTDRGNPPRGNSVSRAPMDPPASGAATRMDQEILVTGLAEGIGISLDLPHGRMYFTDLGGTIYVANLDGTAKTKLLTGQGSLTGIAYLELPP